MVGDDERVHLAHTTDVHVGLRGGWRVEWTVLTPGEIRGNAPPGDSENGVRFAALKSAEPSGAAADCRELGFSAEPVHRAVGAAACGLDAASCSRAILLSSSSTACLPAPVSLRHERKVRTWLSECRPSAEECSGRTTGRPVSGSNRTAVHCRFGCPRMSSCNTDMRAMTHLKA